MPRKPQNTLSPLFWDPRLGVLRHLTIEVWAINDVRLMLQYAFNLFSHNSPMTENGYNEEEMKMVKETKKIWSNNDVNITATCIRVPIMRAHAESINLEFDRDVSEEEVRFWMIARFANFRHECAC